jgi:two-component system cell cycle sensor histidine kinase/response regulator CckA
VALFVYNPGVILVVDDEAGVRQLVRRLAERAGYPVVEASGGEEALALLHSAETQPSLMLTDIVMPGMSGLALAAQAHMLRPSLPVIFMSGFASQYQDELVGNVCLRKPFKSQELLTVIEDVIGPPGRATAYP